MRQLEWQRLQRGGKAHRIVELVRRQQFVQQGHLQAGNAQSALEVRGQAARPARATRFSQHLIGAVLRQQVDDPGRIAMAGDLVSQARRKGIHQAAFDAGFADDELALH